MTTLSRTYGPGVQSESGTEVKNYTDEPNIQAESLAVKRARSNEDLGGPAESPTGLRDDTYMDRPNIQAGFLIEKQDDAHADGPSTPTRHSAQIKESGPHPSTG